MAVHCMPRGLMAEEGAASATGWTQSAADAPHLRRGGSVSVTESAAVSSGATD